MEQYLWIISIILSVLIFLFLLWIADLIRKRNIENAGIQGEEIADAVISNILLKNDIHIMNVEISIDGKRTELDNLIINNNGIFIIEVKNYSGILYGNETNEQWLKEKTTEAGNTYSKTVSNPIRQLKREIYLLKSYLRSNGINVWVGGYIFFVQQNAPCNSRYFLQDAKDIDAVIHHKADKPLSDKTIDKIIQTLR